MRIKPIWAIAKRELGFYFNSPIAYVVITAFLLLCGAYLFIFGKGPDGQTFFDGDVASMRLLFEAIPVFFIFLVPAISMRLISEEKRSGTIELLVTMPITDTEIIVGKFLGGLVFIGIALVATLPLPILVGTLGELDLGAVVAGYIGLLLLGAAYLGLGLMTSVWTQNQIVAYLLGALLCAFFYFIGGMVESVWTGAQDTVAFLSFESHFTNIARGVIDTRDVVFYLSMTALALVISVQSLQSRNWK